MLTETVFAFNGIGQYLFEAIGQRDYPVLQGFIIFIAIIYSLINLIVDVTYGVIDPRVRAGMSIPQLPATPSPDLDVLHVEEMHGDGLWRGAFRRLRRNPTRHHRRAHRARVRARRDLRAAADAVRTGLRGVVGPGDARPACPARPRTTGWASTGSAPTCSTQMVYGARQSLVTAWCRPPSA